MFRIRKITNPYLKGNKQAIEQIKKIIQDQFPDIRREKIDEISLQMVNPVKVRAPLYVKTQVVESSYLHSQADYF